MHKRPTLSSKPESIVFPIKQTIVSCDLQISKISIFFHSYQFTRIFPGGAIKNCVFKVLNYTFALHYVGMWSNINNVDIFIIGKQLFANNKVVTLGVSDMVFSATFNNISVISRRSVLFERTSECPEKATDLSQIIDKLYHIL